MRLLRTALLALALTGTTAAEATYSIVARDPATGEMGVAVQSHWFSVGTVVTWAEAGVGAVATQSLADPAYGPRGLDLMRTEMSAEDALRALLEADDASAVRQVAMIDDDGNVAAHTGDRCIAAAGQIVGINFSVQANLMVSDNIVPAMAHAFEETSGDLAARMMAALTAAQEAGGDIRGKQSAAMLIVKGEGSGRPWADRTLDLRVEDHAEPIEELARLLDVHRAYDSMNRGDVAIEHGDMVLAGQEYARAASLLPGNPEVLFWQAVTLATAGHVAESIPIFQTVFGQGEEWVEVLRRLQPAGIIPATPEGKALVDQIILEARID